MAVPGRLRGSEAAVCEPLCGSTPMITAVNEVSLSQLK